MPHFQLLVLGPVLANPNVVCGVSYEPCLPVRSKGRFGALVAVLVQCHGPTASRTPALKEFRGSGLPVPG